MLFKDTEYGVQSNHFVKPLVQEYFDLVEPYPCIIYFIPSRVPALYLGIHISFAHHPSSKRVVPVVEGSNLTIFFVFFVRLFLFLIY